MDVTRLLKISTRSQCMRYGESEALEGVTIYKKFIIASAWTIHLWCEAQLLENACSARLNSPWISHQNFSWK